jgi:hypothetical protein
MDLPERFVLTDGAVSNAINDISITTNLHPCMKVQDKVSHVANSPAEEIVNALEIIGELFCTTRGKELVLLIGQVCLLVIRSHRKVC